MGWTFISLFGQRLIRNPFFPPVQSFFRRRELPWQWVTFCPSPVVPMVVIACSGSSSGGIHNPIKTGANTTGQVALLATDFYPAKRWDICFSLEPKRMVVMWRMGWGCPPATPSFVCSLISILSFLIFLPAPNPFPSVLSKHARFNQVVEFSLVIGKFDFSSLLTLILRMWEQTF